MSSDLPPRQPIPHSDGQMFVGGGNRLPIGKGEVYAYPHHDIYIDDDDETFWQSRSGPNWMGGLMTLTTCKQRLRTYKADIQDWEGVYLAGFTPKNGTGDNYLLYVAQIQRVFESNHDLYWAMRTWSPDVLEAKLAVNHPCGDIYTPKDVLRGEERYDVNNFIEPEGHTRLEKYPDGTPKWWKDIRYRGVSDRRPAIFLFGETHIWDKREGSATPLFDLGRSGRKFESIDAFAKELQWC